jgi:hypothetical protein
MKKGQSIVITQSRQECYAMAIRNSIDWRGNTWDVQAKVSYTETEEDAVEKSESRFEIRERLIKGVSIRSQSAGKP